jgi:phage-related protein
MAASQSILEILIQAADQSAAAFDSAIGNLNETGQSAQQANAQLQQLGMGLSQAGTMLAGFGAALVAAYAAPVVAASETQESTDELTQTIEDQITAANSAAGSNSSFATQVAFLKDKIDAEKASIAEATATLDTSTGSVAKSAAAHEKAAADIATDSATISKYQNELDLLTNSQTLAGASAEQIAASFTDAARANTELGFSISDSQNSMASLFAATKNVGDTMTAYQAAMDLARAKNEDLGTATNQVIQAFNGMGRGLQTLGINIKDGLSGMDALSAIQDVVNGQATAYSNTLAGSTAAALQQVNKLLSDIGSTQLPMLSHMFDEIGKVINAVDAWTNAHPKLTQAILLVVGIVGALLLGLGSLLIIFGTLISTLATMGTAFGVTAAVVATTLGIITGGFIALGIIVTLIILYHTQIWNAITTAWNATVSFFKDTFADIESFWKTVWGDISNFFKGWWNDIVAAVKVGIDLAVGVIVEALDVFDPTWRQDWQAIATFLTTTWNIMKTVLSDVWNWIVKLFSDSLGTVSAGWNSVWGGIATFFEGIWGGIKSSLSSALSFLQSAIQSFVSWATGVFAPVLSAVNVIGNVASGLVGAAKSAIGTAISIGASVTNVHDAIITPGGQVIQSDPSDYLIATKTPGSLGSRGGSSITINIQGGNYLDQNGATMIGNALAKKIVQQLKVRNYAN